MHWAFIVALAALAAVASWVDVRERRVPNWVSLATLTVGAIYAAVTYGWPGAGWAAAHMVIALLVCMGLTAARVISAGDAKFYAAIAMWLPLDHGLWLLVSVAVCGLIVLGGFVVWRMTARRSGGGRAAGDFAKLPYGVAVGLGGLAAVAMA